MKPRKTRNKILENWWILRLRHHVVALTIMITLCASAEAMRNLLEEVKGKYGKHSLSCIRQAQAGNAMSTSCPGRRRLTPPQDTPFPSQISCSHTIPLRLPYCRLQITRRPRHLLTSTSSAFRSPRPLFTHRRSCRHLTPTRARTVRHCPRRHHGRLKPEHRPPPLHIIHQ
jgi:hypothetical protein